MVRLLSFSVNAAPPRSVNPRHMGYHTSTFSLFALSIITTAWPPAFATAGTVTIDATDSGFVTAVGGSAKGDSTLAPLAKFNYSVGYELHYIGGYLSPPPFTPKLRNNYFVFDLAGVVPGSITSAALKVFAGTYESVDPFEEFVIVAPSDPGIALAEAGFLLVATGGGTSAFDDPGDPTIAIAASLFSNIATGPGPLGGKAISSADDGTIVTISLGAGGLGYLNAFAGSTVILGGKVTTSPPPDSPQQPFGFTAPLVGPTPTPTPTLEITVIPEPTSVSMLFVLILPFVPRRNW